MAVESTAKFKTGIISPVCDRSGVKCSLEEHVATANCKCMREEFLLLFLLFLNISHENWDHFCPLGVKNKGNISKVR